MRFNIRLLLSGHSEPGEYQEGAEEIDEPVKLFDQRRAQAYHGPAHDQRPQYPPKENAMLVFGGNSEVRENKNEDEDIVYAQRFLNEISGEKLQAHLGPELPDNAPVEEQGQSNPHHRPGRRLLHTDLVAIAMKDEEVYRKHD